MNQQFESSVWGRCAKNWCFFSEEPLQSHLGIQYTGFLLNSISTIWYHWSLCWIWRPFLFYMLTTWQLAAPSAPALPVETWIHVLAPWFFGPKRCGTTKISRPSSKATMKNGTLMPRNLAALFVIRQLTTLRFRIDNTICIHLFHIECIYSNVSLGTCTRIEDMCMYHI